MDWLDGAGIALVRGRARLTGPKTLDVTADDGTVTHLTARHAVVVATGYDASSEIFHDVAPTAGPRPGAGVLFAVASVAAQAAGLRAARSVPA